MHIKDLFAADARQAESHGWGPPSSDPNVISLSYGFADPRLFPRAELLAATADVLENDYAQALNYAASYIGLREQLVTRLRSEGVEAELENILISYGSGQVLALLPRVFVERGDIVLIEGPTFMGAVRHFAGSGAKLVTVPTDDQGMDVAALEDILRQLKKNGVRPKFLYTIPTFQNPTGTTMPLARRQKLVELAATYGVVVVEDDAYGDLRFEGQPLPNLAALDQEGWVIRVGTFSKILAPGLRMGWTYARPEVISRLEFFKVEGSSGPFQTRVVAKFCEHGRLEAHIQKLRALYRTKRDLMLTTIQREFPVEVTNSRPEGGFFVWCKLPEGMSATALAKKAAEYKVTFVPGVGFYANGQGDDALRLAFSLQPEDRMVEGIARIGKAMNAM